VPAAPIVPATKKPAAVAPPEGTTDELIAKLKQAEKDFDAAMRAYTNRRLEANELTKAILAGDPKSDAFIPAVVLAGKTGGLAVATTTSIYANVVKYHSASPKIKDLLPMIGRSPKGEEYLETISQVNQDNNVKGVACFMLAESLNRKIDLEKNKEKKKELTTKTLAAFDRAIKDFGDVIYLDSKLSEVAEAAQFSLKYLQVGLVVPDVDGPDMDGKSFKLSDYRGKVVLLDFWGHW
jgi:hypothetical protein